LCRGGSMERLKGCCSARQNGGKAKQFEVA
jgi:hypothetical protein